jgi:hypothetical protein
MSESEVTVDEMDKDQLITYAKSHHNVQLVPRTAIEKLRSQVIELDKKKEAEQPKEAVNEQKADEVKVDEPTHEEPPEAEDVEAASDEEVSDEVVIEKATLPAGSYVLNPSTGGIFLASGRMAKIHDEWPPCDEKGTVLR